MLLTSVYILTLCRKTGWANQTSTVPNVEVVTSYEFPDDAPTRIQNAHIALAQLAGSGLTNAAPLAPPTDIAATAEAALNAALGLPATTTAAATAPQVPAAVNIPAEVAAPTSTPHNVTASPPQATAPQVAVASISRRQGDWWSGQSNQGHSCPQHV